VSEKLPKKNSIEIDTTSAVKCLEKLGERVKKLKEDLASIGLHQFTEWKGDVATEEVFVESGLAGKLSEELKNNMFFPGGIIARDCINMSPDGIESFDAVIRKKNIEKIKSMKKELERGIEKMLEDFHEKTGVYNINATASLNCTKKISPSHSINQNSESVQEFSSETKSECSVWINL
jgi:hypothetical protein